MKNVIIIVLTAFIVSAIAFHSKGTYEYRPNIYYNRYGVQMYPEGRKVFQDSFSVTNPNGFAVDLSKAAFDSVKAVYLTTSRNTNTATDVPRAEVRTLTNSMLTVNIVQGNGTTVNLLGSLVQLGTSNTFATNPSDIRLFVTVIGK